MKLTFNFNNWPAVVASILAIILMSSTAHHSYTLVCTMWFRELF